MIDSYEAFIPQYISQEDFFRFGLEQTIYIPDEKVKLGWEQLKAAVSSNKTVYMRGLKDNSSNHLFFDFYKKLFKNEHATKDPSNSQNSTKEMERLSGLKKSKDLRNYQLSSIFGKSRNVLAFTAPWNLVYIPKLLDALLGEEAKGEMAAAYQKAFHQHAYTKFKPYIEDFNSIVTNRHFLQAMDDHYASLYDNKMYDRETLVKFEEILRDEFAPIELS